MSTHAVSDFWALGGSFVSNHSVVGFTGLEETETNKSSNRVEYVCMVGIMCIYIHIYASKVGKIGN